MIANSCAGNSSEGVGNSVIPGENKYTNTCLVLDYCYTGGGIQFDTHKFQFNIEVLGYIYNNNVR